MAPHARIVPAGLLAAAAALAPVVAHAFDKVDSLAPIPAGRAYVYYVHEVDTDHQPIQGRTVTISVKRAPGSDATVAPCDATGHPTGPAGHTATESSGADGFAYFLLTTSSTPGSNEFTWADGTYTGQVTVVGLGATPLASPSAAVAATPHATPPAGSHSHRSSAAGAGVAPSRPHLPPGGVPPLVAGMVATLLVWLLVPPMLARRARQGRPLLGALDSAASNTAVGPGLSRLH